MKNLILILFAVLFCSTALAVDIKEIEKELATTGVEGWIHGDDPSLGLYVFTYRTPGNFFDYLEMSLVSFDPEVLKQLATLNRHDKIRVRGQFIGSNPSPQKHIVVSSIDLVEKYNNPYPTDPYGYQAVVPDELKNLTSANFLVHAVVEGGHILVVEYKDVICPIFVKNADLTKDLFRNDVVKLNFSIQAFPNQPTHLVLDESGSKSVQVLDSIKTKHGKPAVVEGALILFPKSPEILFNVFAVQQSLDDGLKRQYTLVNFDSPEVFKQIRAALQAAWDRHPGKVVSGRNKLVSTAIKVRATGTFNEVDANQANPQILLDSVNSIEILE